MSVKERIKAFAKSQEKSIRVFEEKSGLNIGYINAIRVSIQPEKIQSIASNYPNLNIDWLLTGNGKMLKSGDKNEVNEPAERYNCSSCKEKQRQIDQLIGENNVLREQLNLPIPERNKKVS